MKRSILLTPMILAALVGGLVNSVSGGSAPNKTEVIRHYADIAHAGYSDSLTLARKLHGDILELIANPSKEALQNARNSWVTARAPYQQTEVYRFGNAIVDDWEGKVNAWPLDEGLIDYVDASYGSESDENVLYTANVIANPKLTLGSRMLDAQNISPNLLAEQLHEVDNVEANVATGYHAIEFLLWGQDLNGNGPGAGQRPYTDFDTSNCTGGNCQRRIDYLRAASELLISDLKWIVVQWADEGDARAALMNSSPESALSSILVGMGSLSYGELAGERMKLGLILHDPEEEHDCFSDNTHNSHFYDALGVRNVYTGAYKRIDGSVLEGPSLSELVALVDASVDAAMRQDLENTMRKMQTLVDSANSGEAYDQLIGEGNVNGNAKVQAAIDALLNQTKSIEKIVSVLSVGGVDFEGSDSLDNPSSIN